MSTFNFPSFSRSLNVGFHQSNQLNRIQNGLREGSVSGGEAQHLMGQQTGIANAASSALADGRMSRGEFRQVRGLQREASRDIFEARHNGCGASGAMAANVGGHQSNQLKRIQNGLGEGSISSSEAQHLTGQQARIAEAQSSAMADGKMGWGEFRQVCRLQREASRDIFEARHNGGSPCDLQVPASPSGSSAPQPSGAPAPQSGSSVSLDLAVALNLSLKVAA